MDIGKSLMTRLSPGGRHGLASGEQRDPIGYAVAALNKLTQTIPWMFLTGIANVHKREFYDAPDGQDVAPQVKF